MQNSVENQIADAGNCVEELQEAMDVAIKALDILDGAIDDADSIEDLELLWIAGTPDVNNLTRKLKLISAEFTHTESLL